MKLDRRKCRKYADRELKIPKSNGLLYAEQIGYIIRTAVRGIDHHRVLILYVYPQEDVMEGDFRPKFTVFQGRDDFVTLARKEDGTAAWRVSAIWAKAGRSGGNAPFSAPRMRNASRGSSGKKRKRDCISWHGYSPGYSSREGWKGSAGRSRRYLTAWRRCRRSRRT